MVYEAGNVSAGAAAVIVRLNVRRRFLLLKSYLAENFESDLRIACN